MYQAQFSPFRSAAFLRCENLAGNEARAILAGQQQSTSAPPPSGQAVAAASATATTLLVRALAALQNLRNAGQSRMTGK